MDLEIMYADVAPDGVTWLGTTSRIRKPHDEVLTFPKPNVLFMIFSAVTTEAMARMHIDGVPYRRRMAVSGWDNYAYLKYTGEGQPAVTLFGWDNGEYTWTNINNPFSPSPPSPLHPLPHWDDKINWPPWMPSGAIFFTGFTLPMADWERVRKDFSDNMH